MTSQISIYIILVFVAIINCVQIPGTIVRVELESRLKHHSNRMSCNGYSISYNQVLIPYNCLQGFDNIIINIFYHEHYVSEYPSYKVGFNSNFNQSIPDRECGLALITLIDNFYQNPTI